MRGPRKGSLCEVVEVPFDLGFQIRRKHPPALYQPRDASLWGYVHTKKIPLQSQPLSKHSLNQSTPEIDLELAYQSKQRRASHLKVTVTDGAIDRSSAPLWTEPVFGGEKISHG